MLNYPGGMKSYLQVLLTHSQTVSAWSHWSLAVMTYQQIYSTHFIAQQNPLSKTPMSLVVEKY